MMDNKESGGLGIAEVPAWAGLCAQSAVCGIPIEELEAPEDIKAQAIAARDAGADQAKMRVDAIRTAVLAFLGGESAAFGVLFPGVLPSDYRAREYLTMVLVAAFNAGVYVPKAQAARMKNQAARTETLAQWERAKAEGMSKAEYSRTRAPILNRNGTKVTDRTIETRWLKGL